MTKLKTLPEPVSVSAAPAPSVTVREAAFKAQPSAGLTVRETLVPGLAREGLAVTLPFVNRGTFTALVLSWTGAFSNSALTVTFLPGMVKV
jgi:hypothetical protein